MVKRERIVLGAGALVLAVIFLLQFVLLPAVTALESTERHVAGLTLQLQQLDQIAGQMDTGAVNQSMAGERVDALLPWLERNINQAGLSPGLEQISPKAGNGSEYRDLAVVRLKQVDLSNLLLLLGKIERTAALKVVRGRLSRHGQRGVNFEAEVGLY